jgi:hypothetical protein
VSDTTIPFTKDEALDTSGGSLPAGIERKEYESLLYELEDKGLEKLKPSKLKTIKKVIEHQRSVSMGTPSQQPAQDAPSGVEPLKRRVKLKTRHRGLQGLLRANLTMLAVLPPMTHRQI